MSALPSDVLPSSDESSDEEEPSIPPRCGPPYAEDSFSWADLSGFSGADTVEISDTPFFHLALFNQDAFAFYKAAIRCRDPKYKAPDVAPLRNLLEKGLIYFCAAVNTIDQKDDVGAGITLFLIGVYRLLGLAESENTSPWSDSSHFLRTNPATYFSKKFAIPSFDVDKALLKALIDAAPPLILPPKPKVPKARSKAKTTVAPEVPKATPLENPKSSKSKASTRTSSKAQELSKPVKVESINPPSNSGSRNIAGRNLRNRPPTQYEQDDSSDNLEPDYILDSDEEDVVPSKPATQKDGKKKAASGDLVIGGVNIDALTVHVQT
ncbi:hypothetical protein R3P38DRAFT_3516403 [Favolaschia claudopus]|uniref:Uncharacterized protein n=1 Tax=Favolaschia claudopus TaxID=2862362 RepID=A0AAW0BQ41_9AGAR